MASRLTRYECENMQKQNDTLACTGIRVGSERKRPEEWWKRERESEGGG